MSICLDNIALRENKEERVSLRTTIRKNDRSILRCSENILKPKCNKALKRKLKKYKLRKDGKEDQEIIDVSLSFIKSLTIKSPSQTITESKKDSKDKHSVIMGRKKRNNVIKVAEVNDINSVTSAQLVSCQDTQEKKQTDAFKLLMDSRNKIIGGNSPGKECIAERSLDQEIVERKEIKARRILSLQKMTQGKGATESLKQEEARDLYIKEKMENRAERLKNMITKSNTQSHKKVINELSAIKSCETKEKSMKGEIISDNQNIILNQTLSSIVPDNHVPRTTLNKTVSEEDINFLKKLSPSMRKKENMLCYFNVITKDVECVSNTSENNIHESNSETIIKVKFTHKKKRKKDAVNHQTGHTIPVDSNNIIDCTLIEKGKCASEDTGSFEIDNRQKRKRKKQVIDSDHNNCLEDMLVETRPKRNTKKPAKLMESALSSSSDEELHIFTPKKKKSSEHKLEVVKTNKIENTKQETNRQIDKTLKKNQNKKSSKMKEKIPLKLAPIFVTKSQLSAEELKAKQQFLHSGIPRHIKKSVSLKTNNTSYNVFPMVRHIQQISPRCKEVDNVISSVSLSYSDEEIDVTNVDTNLLRSLLNLDFKEPNLTLDIKYKVETLLRMMKHMYPTFPVYRTYKSLKAKSKGQHGESQYNNLDNSAEVINSISDIWNDHPDKLKWTDKYKAISTKQIIGNFDSIKQLKKWLITWTETVDETKNNSDSDFCYSDTDSGDVIRMRNNLLILMGKTGSGKTSSVYAVASELSMKVIEVNASSKRTGKIMLQDLQEATQSHKVDRQKDSERLSQKSVDKDITILKKTKRRGKSTKSKEKLNQKPLSIKNNSESFSSQDSIRTGMSLILIDDADIVFEQDDGFCSAVAQIVHRSKRPVILVTDSLQCPHLQKFLKYGQVIKLQPLPPRMLGTWLDVMCLADIGICYPGLGAKLLDFFRGDIRKCINHLQYYITSQKHRSIQKSVSEVSELLNNKLDVNDETSRISWTDNDDSVEKTSMSNDFLDLSINYYMCKQLDMHSPSHSPLFNVWWSLPQLLDFGIIEKNSCSTKELLNITNETFDLETISSVMNDFSLLDMFQHTGELYTDITSRPWFSTEKASLTENENFACYDDNNEVKQNIAYSLMKDSIKHVQKILKCKHRSNIHFPSMSRQRERNNIVDIHKNLANFLNPSAVLDRKAVSLDYWSICRDICRIERTKTDSSIKRNNRFCHYLKSINILCKHNDFDKLSYSLCSDA